MQYIRFGCKTNQYESNAIIQKFVQNGYKCVSFDEKADVYIVNTCTVTSISDRKSRQMLRRAKQNNKNSILVVTGCYVQVAKKELEKIEEIDILLGNNEKKDILEYVENFKKEKEVKSDDIMHGSEYLEFGTTTYTEKTRAVIKIQDGCNNFCTYCIIPYARGRIRSRKINAVLEEIKEVTKLGIKEVVLTGIHLASYGKDFEEDIELIDLLEEINKIDNIDRVRLGSLEPKLITKEFVDRLKKLDKICHQFHLSLQSGCTATLKRMNRKYTKEEFREAVTLLKNEFEDVILTADLIVGFPGETEEEFNETYEFLKEIKFYKIHVFKYSKREGTNAATFENQVSDQIKDERSKKVIMLSKKIQEEYNKSFISQVFSVLVEEKDGKYYKGHTKNYLNIWIDNLKENAENKIVQIKIEDVKNEKLMGKVINRKM